MSDATLKLVSLGVLEPQGVLNGLLDSVHDGVYIVDRLRRIVYWNRIAEGMTGYNADEVLGKTCGNRILNHADAEGEPLCDGNCPLSKALEQGRLLQSKVYVRHKSGNRFPVKLHVHPLANEEGEIVAAIAVFNNISAEEDFRILQEKFNAVIKKYVSSYTFHNIVRQVQSGVDNKTQKRHLTIVFIDIVGFSGFAETSLPEEAVKRLNDFFWICESVIDRFHGDIDKFIGDAVLAVFVDADDAIAAGRKVLSVISQLNSIKMMEGMQPISVRIGINSGTVIQGDIGGTGRKDLTVIGDVVNTASRIQNEAEIDSIYISEATFSRLRNSAEFEFVRQISVTGKRNLVSLYRLRNRTRANLDSAGR
ncbi:MAG: adenylate/guanylate cyclase domain-containing protein [Eubacteriales bacterium]|jgi:PAS domain S-box-containing protein|nr:PAS domain-containing protein [Bacillota bacterium]MBV1726837.1 PAS domain-containing protein [Desulforudis sp.]MDP3050858.1 adenylate/guanylate cyclase domain-containing protein [Eubacteriales bacterium]MDQ7790218.1 adenylate/guanylate cyclase domain-containing protein [Clostridia bacterium]MBV1736010.1 PAS domain-containing protein [Desulforudis sp.]